MMARIRKDKTSWHGAGMWEKTYGPRPEISKHSAKKNTRKWCKGEVGVKHKWVFIEKDDYFAKYGFKTYYHYKCSVCGRKNIYLHEPLADAHR